MPIVTTEKENKQYNAMLTSIAERLNAMDVYRIAQNAGFSVDPQMQTIEFESFARKGVLQLPEYTVTGSIEMWQHLAVLQYLESDPSPYHEGNWVTIGSLEPGDVMRGASFDRDISRLIGSKLSDRPEEDIRSSCLNFGGMFIDDRKADITVVFYFLPYYPMLLNLWFADEEFPASGKVLINSGAGRSLGLEAAGTIALFLVQKICGVFA